MNEIKLILAGLAGLIILALVFWFIDMPKSIEDVDVDIIIALSVGLLILTVDKRQERHLHKISEIQHTMISDIHQIVKEQMNMIAELHKLQITDPKK